MCYLIGRRRYGIGCVALKTALGQHLVKLKKSIRETAGDQPIQLITISRPAAYGEYEPYHFVETEQEFFEAVLHLADEPSAFESL